MANNSDRNKRNRSPDDEESEKVDIWVTCRGCDHKCYSRNLKNHVMKRHKKNYEALYCTNPKCRRKFFKKQMCLDITPIYSAEELKQRHTDYEVFSCKKMCNQIHITKSAANECDNRQEKYKKQKSSTPEAERTCPTCDNIYVTSGTFKKHEIGGRSCNSRVQRNKINETIAQNPKMSK